MSEIEEPIAEEPVAKALPVDVVAELEKVGISASTDAELAAVKEAVDALPVVQAELASKTAELDAAKDALDKATFTPEQLAVRARREEVTRFYAWVMNVSLVGDKTPPTMEDLLATWRGGG